MAGASLQEQAAVVGRALTRIQLRKIQEQLGKVEESLDELSDRDYFGLTFDTSDKIGDGRTAINNLMVALQRGINEIPQEDFNEWSDSSVHISRK
jgi:methyl-accepting chemotaxis protein